MPSTRTGRRSRRRVAGVVGGAVLAVLVVVAAASYVVDQDGISLDGASGAVNAYVSVFLLVALDAVVPVFPGETTLNASATAAANGTLPLLPVIVAGALGAIVGDSALFWIARLSASRVDGSLSKARRNPKVAQAFDLLGSSPGLLIVGGRYVVGMRFVVNATMGMSEIRYRRFLAWSVLSGVLWSTYTCLLAYKVATTFADLPMASMVISGLVTMVVILVVFIAVRRRRTARRAEVAGTSA